MTDYTTAAPKVSVIMPAYNVERFVEAAVRSVMEQTVTDWELLVLDDGSRDGTCAVVERLAAEDPRVRLIRNRQNMGVAKTRNRGFDLCAGQYIALLDSDDVWHGDKLEKQLALMEETGADICYCSYAIVDDQGNKVKGDYKVPSRVDFNGLVKENVIGCSTVVLRRSVIEKHRFITDFYHEDYVLWLELLRSGYRAAGCTQTLVDWRLILNSRSFNKRNAAKNRWKIYREYLKLPLGRSIVAFAAYGTASLKKYFAKVR